MKLFNNKKLIFAVIPIITFAICSFLALYFNKSYFIDPDFVYLINGLNVFQGDFNSIIHVDHPGTPLQMLIGGMIAIIGTLRGAENIALDVVSKPQIYIKTIILFIATLNSIVLYFIGLRYHKHNSNLFQSLLIQLSVLFSATVLFSYTKLYTETLLPLGTLLLILCSIEFVWGKMKSLHFTILSGIIIGIFIAVKITFIPLIFLPFILINKWYHKIFFVLTSVALFTLSVLPIISKLTFFKEFLVTIATHDGLYGQGPEAKIDAFQILHNIWNLLNMEYSFTIVFLALCISIIVLAFKQKMQIFKDKEVKLIFAIISCFIIQLIIVSKHAGIRYMIPSLVLSMFAITIILSKLKVKRIFLYILLSIVLAFGIMENIKKFSKYYNTIKTQSITYDFINSNITKNDAVLVVSSESWFGSPFVAHSLMFGKLYCMNQGAKYASILKQSYPKFYFWTHHNQQYSNWENNLLPDQILNTEKSIYLYVQTDKTELYQNLMEDFTNRLKFISKDSVEVKLCFSNKEFGEEIYHITIHSSMRVKPKFSLHCDFEKSDSINYNLIQTDNDTIFIEDGLRRTDYSKFEGKYSVCITKENPYGISVKFSNVKQFDLIRVSVKIHRSTKKDECCIAIKSLNPEDGFSTNGGFINDCLNGWENLTYTYRITNQLLDGNIEIFVWNISKNPMCFDNLEIEVY